MGGAPHTPSVVVPDMLHMPVDVLAEAAHARTLQPAFWHWRSAFTWSWDQTAHDHINVLELRAALNGLR